MLREFSVSRENLYFSAMGLRVERKAKRNIFKESFLTSNRLQLSYSAPGAQIKQYTESNAVTWETVIITADLYPELVPWLAFRGWRSLKLDRAS